MYIPCKTVVTLDLSGKGILCIPRKTVVTLVLSGKRTMYVSPVNCCYISTICKTLYISTVWQNNHVFPVNCCYIDSILQNNHVFPVNCCYISSIWQNNHVSPAKLFILVLSGKITMYSV